jgi:hypothetical protein
MKHHLGVFEDSLEGPVPDTRIAMPGGSVRPGRHSDQPACTPARMRGSMV